LKYFINLKTLELGVALPYCPPIATRLVATVFWLQQRRIWMIGGLGPRRGGMPHVLIQNVCENIWYQMWNI